MPLGPLPFPGPPSRLGVQSPQEAIVVALGGGHRDSRRILGANPCPGPQSTLEGHQVQVAALEAEETSHW